MIQRLNDLRVPADDPVGRPLGKAFAVLNSRVPRVNAEAVERFELRPMKCPSKRLQLRLAHHAHFHEVCLGLVCSMACWAHSDAQAGWPVWGVAFNLHHGQEFAV